MLANSREEALVEAEFKRAGYKDRFINAYADRQEKSQAPSLLRIIIRKENDYCYGSVMKRIHDTIGGHPTVIDSGTELTIIQLVDAPILESLPEFKPFIHLWPSNLFLKFAAEYLSEGLDTTTPSFESCMIPIPGSTTKNGTQVKIIYEEKWDPDLEYRRPSVLPLLESFLKYLKDLTDF